LDIEPNNLIRTELLQSLKPNKEEIFNELIN